MIRNLLLVGWLALPIGAWAFHEGPGQDLVALEDADAVLVAAAAAAADGDWRDAAKRYEEALQLLPASLADGPMRFLFDRTRLELNKARMLASELPTAREELGAMVADLEQQPSADPTLLADARQQLARAQFYTTWLMRLEGLTREQWEPEIEAARQNYRLLAEQAADGAVAAAHQQDLEAAIRLSRLEIEDLQGLPLPSE